MTLTNRFASNPAVAGVRTAFTSETTGSTTVEIGRFVAGDRDGFLSLYETVFERERGSDWFRWKYRENPYVDHVPILVARADGDVVGCRSFFAQELRVEGEPRLAFQPCDTMVHPDYRRRGLFSRMNELAIERYTDGDPTCFFNFPNEYSKPGNLSQGWREIGTVPAYYRPQNPVDVLTTWADSVTAERLTEGRSFDGGSIDWFDGGPIDSFDGDSIAAVLRTVADVPNAAHRIGDRLLSRSAPEVRVERHDSPPASQLEAIYERSVPDAIHTNRTAEFYRWRLSNPAHSYVTYVARREGTPVAALVVSYVGDRTRIVETLPRSIDVERDALERLLVHALAVHDDRPVVTAFGRSIPTPIRYRFYPDTRFPLSSLQPSARTLLARDLDGDVDVERSAIDDWTFSRLELDTT